MSQAFDTTYIARLAQIDLSPEELEALDREFPKILKLVEKLSACDTQNVAPTFHPLEICDQMRVDEAKMGLSLDAVLENAPSHDGEQFSMPKVVETA